MPESTPAEDQAPEKKHLPLAAKLGISALSSAIGIAAGVYVVEKLSDRK